mmetsp:Transcript_20088/g.56954  ORF Transcript_20088/g.56954 Transcript_20088/m.56954 type:complete len:218 (+) Transcript_20088:84-737(+)
MYSSGVHFMNSLRWCMCCWAMYASLKFLCLFNSPSSFHGCNSPAIIDINVDLPAPFFPTTATRLEKVKRTVTSLSTGPWDSSYWKVALFNVSTGLLAVMPTIFSGIGNVIFPSSMRSSLKPGCIVGPMPPAMLASFMISSNFLASASLPPRAVFLKASKLPAWYASFPSEVKCTTSVQTLFRKSGSWETIMAVPPVFPPMQVLLMNSTSHAVAWTSK